MDLMPFSILVFVFIVTLSNPINTDKYIVGAGLRGYAQRLRLILFQHPTALYVKLLYHIVWFHSGLKC